MKNIINEYNINFFYTLTHGGSDVYQFENKNIWSKCKTIKHCVFDTSCPESDFYISIGEFLNHKHNTNYSIIPHMIDLPDCNENLRSELQIPEDAIVLGRYGSHDQFNIPFVIETIKDFLNTNTNTYFLFMSTNKFYEHPQIIYLDKNTDLIYKTKFINTCDAMIHAREMGETFGLSIGEFSSKNKPIITSPRGYDLEHIKILGDKAIQYSSKEELMNIFTNIKEIIATRTDWNAHKDYTPENVMKLFNDLIFNKKD
jgi:hypothetical protein